MLVSYPALFYYDNSENVKYFVNFPDFKNSATQGNDISDAMLMAADWLGLVVADMIEDNKDLPKPSDINRLSLKNNNPFADDPDMDLNYDPSKSFISMVTTDLTNYLDSGQPIKKTLTIPKWADKVGRELNLNFSQTLTDAITEKHLSRNK
ncbi:hypothetical protein BSQ39_08265 [Loigolactobacillus backii]|uniref:type II toxin-antitoxin system HicB family antitoxin n=1 Tax=Loigolactobacillus backii TaxID=375175 RepID=UPI000C1CA8A0|nr:type II toxin-antitoxin system HicB family antitoxin [Loigolactobacillus backii]PIO83557.1 hypothetical protein BSQ39_08265 [Loigolactobacillus backii]